MRLPDPRDGDLEDDFSSTSHHSLLRQASRLLLEISLPKLLLAAGLLLVVPALLIGAAPKLAIWFVEAVWDQVSEFGRILSLLAFGLIVVLFAWRFWAGMFLVVERNFWALNAGLVQPLYMALREGVRVVIEAAWRHDTLAGTRRVAGLIAGGLIALAAGAVAWSVGPWPTLMIDDISWAMLPQALRDSLGNGVWFIAVYLMIGAPAWSIGEALAGTPTDLGPDLDPGPARWRIAHLSDIHMVGDPYGFRLESGRAGPRGDAGVARTLAAVAAEDARQRLDWILITGDITDAGRRAEFIAFDDAMAAQPGLRDRVLIIPGNHDVNIVDRANPSRLELPIGPGGALRRGRMLAAMARLQGGRVHVMDHRRRCLGATLDGFLAAEGRARDLRHFMGAAGVAAGLRARKTWNEAFPMVVPPARPDGLGVLLLDSNAETHFSFTNALGLVGEGQMRAAEAAMAQFPAARWLVALHHHLVEYPRPGASVAERIGTALVNGHWVLGRLRRVAPRIVALHGHRHVDWMGRCGAVRILSAPSPVMGSPDGQGRYFWAHGFAPAAAGGLALVASRRVAVA